MWPVTNPLSLNTQELYFAFQHKQDLLLKGFANKILCWKELIRHKIEHSSWIALSSAKESFKLNTLSWVTAI